MDGDRGSANIGDHEIWEQRIARLKALDSGSRTYPSAEKRYRVYLLLRAAVEGGDVDEFIAALEKCSAEERVSLSDIIHVQGPSRNLLLHVAAGIEKADILRALLEVIPDERLVAKANRLGDTALHIAARAGRIRSAELLLGRGGIVDLVNEAGNTPLHEAVKNGHYELTRLLLGRGSRPDRPNNEESKCPLYSAVETGDLKILELLVEAMGESEVPRSMKRGMSPVHGAVMHRRIDMLNVMSRRKKELFDLEHGGFGTPLHLAAFMNYGGGVKFLVDQFASSAFKSDGEGYLPIHVACKMGHLKTIKEMLRHWPEPEELLELYEGQTILHIAAKHGRASVVKYMLGDPAFEKLINAKDKSGNTPLHAATSEWQPEVLLSLTRDNRVDLKLANNSGLTALDIADEQLKVDAPLYQSLTQIILVSAGAPRSKDRAIFQPGSGPERHLDPQALDLDRLTQMANARIVVATLVASMTFAAGFSIPGGHDHSEPDAGIAMLLNKPMHGVFMICNTVAMYSSIIAVLILLWMQINDAHAAHHALRRATLLLLVALATMCVAFTAGVYVTLSKRMWIAAFASIIGIAALVIISVLCIALVVLLGCNCPHLLPFADYIIKVGISISRSVTGARAIRTQPPQFENLDQRFWILPTMLPMFGTLMESEDSEESDDSAEAEDSED